MSDVNIVTGDLEALSSDIGDVASDVGGVDLVTAMADAPSAMPGSESANSWIGPTASEVDNRRTSVKDKYQDLSDDVQSAANSYGQNEADVEASLRSAGTLPPQSDDSGTTSTGTYGDWQSRMEGN